MLTTATLLFCCAYASGVLKNVAPHSWHPISAAPVIETGLGAPLGHRIFGVALAGNALHKWSTGTKVHPELLMSFQSWYSEPMPARALRADQKVGVHAEMFTWQPGRVAWMRHLASYAAHTSWLKDVVWSQAPSYGAGNMQVGNMQWQIWQDKNPQALQAFRELAVDVVKPVNPARNTVAAGHGG